MRFYRTLLPIAAISFDLDDTLYDNQPVIEKLQRQVTAWLHHYYPRSTQKEAAWWEVIKQQVAIQKPELKQDVTQWRFVQIQQGLMALGYSYQQAQLAASGAIMEMQRWRSAFEVPADNKATLVYLAQHYPLVAITNGNVDVHNIGLGSCFSAVFQAGIDGAAKPDPDLFKRAQHYLKLEPHQILHVGDHLVSDVLGAKYSGFQTCWLNTQQCTLRHCVSACLLPDLEINHLPSLRQLTV